MGTTIVAGVQRALGYAAGALMRLWASIPQEHQADILGHLWLAATGLVKKGITFIADLIAAAIEKVREWTGLDEPPSLRAVA